MGRASVVCLLVLVPLLSAGPRPLSQSVDRQTAAPTDITARIAPASGQSSFLTGEPIDLTLTVTTSSSDYALPATDDLPFPGDVLPVSGVMVTPASGVFTWREAFRTQVPARTYDLGRAPFISDSLHVQLKMEPGEPWTTRRTLNDMVRFDSSGTHEVQLTVEVATDSRSAMLVIPTNVLRLDVHAMPEAEEKRRVDDLTRALRTTRRDYPAAFEACRELAYLPGPIAARAKSVLLADLTRRDDYRCAQWLHEGLFITRDAAEELTSLRSAWRDKSGTPTLSLLHDLTELELWLNGAHVGCQESAAARYLEELADGFSARSGTARRAAALLLAFGVAEPPLGVWTTVAREFSRLESHDRLVLLGEARWPYMRQPILIPVLQSMLRSDEYGAYERAAILERLADLAPDVARSFVMDEIADSPTRLRGAPGLDRDVGEAAAKAIQGAGPNLAADDTKTWLLWRYGDGSEYSGMRDVYLRHGNGWDPFVKAGMLAYLTKWNPAEGQTLMRAAAEEDLGPDVLGALASLAPSAVVHEILVELMGSEDDRKAGIAALMLGHLGAATDADIVKRALRQWRIVHAGLIERSDDVEPTAEARMLGALIVSAAWHVPREEIVLLRSGCVSTSCRQVDLPAAPTALTRCAEPWRELAFRR